LVGGRGTRLGDLARDTPKPLLPIVGDRRFLDFLLENIARHGVSEIILLAGHMGDQVQRRYHDARIRGATVKVVIEPAPAGTAGALTYARDMLDDVFLMSNGDSFVDVNYIALARQLKPTMDGALALRRVEDVRRYAHVQLDGDRIAAFREKDASAAGAGLISAGVYVLRKSVLDRVKAVPCSIEVDIFQALATEGRLAGMAVPGGYFLDIGLPDTLQQARAEFPHVMRRRAILFDRDGTLNSDPGYVHKPSDLTLLPGVAEAVRAVNDCGALAIVVTNQSGIARGMYDEDAAGTFHQAMQAELARAGAHIDAFYLCPFHEDGAVPELTVKDHPDRKPGAGMLRRAMLDWDIDRTGASVIGDKDIDVAAGKAAGVRAFKVSPGGIGGAVAEALASGQGDGGDLAAVRHALKDRAARARAWLFDAALPLWWNTGFDRDSRTFHERIALDGKPLLLPRRLRVQARQTFVYSLAGQLGWNGPWREAAEAGAEVLIRHGIRADGGTTYALDPAGRNISDDRRDLYDAAFLIFALASAAKALKRPDFAGRAMDVLDWLVANWSHPQGGFLEGDLVTVPPRRQNPHMHMLEALLQLFEATGESRLLDHAAKIVTLIESKWVSTRWGALLEYFNDDWTPRPGEEGRIAEPGHQFEWAWLLDRYARLSGARISPVASRIYLHGEVYGVDPATGVTVDETWAEGGVRTPTSRFWPHTERIKANIVRHEQTGSISAARNCIEAFDVLMTYCDVPVPGLWRDRRLAQGGFIEEAAPASSFYHAALAMSELIRVADALP
jgi:D-glycero-D-manno-heptose 1,7-bisphosphate phosphatase